MRVMQRILSWAADDDGHSAVEHAAVIAFVLTILIVGVRSAGDVVQIVFSDSEDAMTAGDAGNQQSRSATSRRRVTDDDDSPADTTSRIEARRETLRIAAARARHRSEFQAKSGVTADAENAPTARVAEHHRPYVEPIR